MTYSCARFVTPDTSLADAQAAKHELICQKLGLADGSVPARGDGDRQRRRLLDVGCGWGSMALHAAIHHDVDVVGVTISDEQALYARQRVADAGLADRVEIRVQDYRDVRDGPYDAISSIGMAEHVPVMVAAVVIAVLVMMIAAGPISDFVEDHPTIKILALSFLLLIGMSLIAEGLGQHIPKGYIYFAMGFSVFVEMLNLRMRKANSGAKPIRLRQRIAPKRRSPLPPKMRMIDGD